ncbi:BrxA family protein [Desulfonatronum parangueonense]
MTKAVYTTRLQAGLGMVQETRTLLDLWEPGMDASALLRIALENGQLPGISARRLRNLVMEGFAPRLLVNDTRPAQLARNLMPLFSQSEFEQLLFVFACRANPILADFTRTMYWPAYSSGHGTLSNEQAREFVTEANRSGKTAKPWSDSTIMRMAGYLTGCLADFGLLEPGRRSERRFVPFHGQPRSLTALVYEMHFAGLGDNQILSHPDWGLFGLERADMLDQFKRFALKGWIILQSAGGVTRIGWPCKNLEELQRVLA